MNGTPLRQTMPDGRRVIDSRYTITREFTGAPRVQFVARFCGDWIGSSAFYSSALALLAGARAAREGALIVTAIESP
jgi:hypothetical protein